jgi:RsiW-degrading membrane proteinase PrsW (M82 family)
MPEFFKESKNIIIAILSGAVPAILWLWFWLKQEDEEDPEPVGLIILTFIVGGLLVFIAIAMEKYSLNFISDSTFQIVVWAAIEEILKFVGVMTLVWGTRIINEPIDYPMYFIACALGFAALENVLYLIEPLKASGTVVGMLTGNLRFLGSTLLHAICSGMVGSALGLAYYLQRYRNKYLLVGLLLAIVLHSTFNFFIMKGSGENFLGIFGFLWVVTIINILIFEKLKRMKKNILSYAVQ